MVVNEVVGIKKNCYAQFVTIKNLQTYQFQFKFGNVTTNERKRWKNSNNDIEVIESLFDNVVLMLNREKFLEKKQCSKTLLLFFCFQLII